MASKDVNDVLDNGGTLVEMVSNAVDAHVKRASDKVKEIAAKLQSIEPQDRSEAIELMISKSSYVAAIGNGCLRDKEMIKPQLIDLARIPGCREGVQKLVLAVDHYMRSGIKVADGPSVLAFELLNDIATSEYPIPRSLVVPQEYMLTATSVSRIVHSPDGEEVVEFAQCPIIPTGIMKDMDTGKEMVVLSWNMGEWVHIIVPREDVTTRGRAELLSGYGVPVSSANSAALARYISDMLITNYRTMPRARVTARMGWHADNSAFLWGRTLITDTRLIEYKFDVDKTSPAVWDIHGIYFRPGDAGAAQLATALGSKGTFEKWQEAIKFLDSRPEARAGIIMALIPPLLPIIQNSAPFTVDWGGSTSRGKSTTLLYASSVWALGTEDGNRFFNSWDTTRVNLERTLSILRHIPLIVDDTKKARKPDEVARIIYDITSGIGRGRASVSGLAISGEYRTIMMTTGESRVTSFSHDGGAFTRVLQFFGSPLGGALSPEEVRQLNESVSGIAANYGHLGPRFVQRLIANKDQWGALQSQFDKLYAKWSASGAGFSPYSGRLAKYMAIFELASQLASGFFGGLGKFTQEELQKFWTSWCKFANDADQPKAALAYVMNRCFLEKHVMWRLVRSDPKFNPPGGWRGYLPTLPTTDGIYLARLWIDKWLSEAGYDKANCYESWVQHGWIAKNPKNGSELFPVPVDGSTVLLCHIPASAIKSILDN